MQEIEVKRIEAYSLLDFALLLQAAIDEGYRVNDSNENYPQQIGSYMTAGLTKQAIKQAGKKKAKEQVTQSETTQDEQEVTNAAAQLPVEESTSDKSE